MSSRFAYLLERYPAFTQTFIVREVEEMRRQGVAAPVFSLRAPDEDPGGHFSKTATEKVIYTPEAGALVTEIKRRRADGELSAKINQRLEAWGKAPDKMRLYEAIWTGAEMRENGIRHVHVHFAGLAARTAFLIKELYGITYSWTGHAQDIFCQTEYAVGVNDLIREATAVVTVADFSAIQLRKAYPKQAGKIHRIYNGLSVPTTLPKRTETQPPLVLSVGRLIAKKGFADLIQACAKLQERGIAFSCQIVGDGPLEDSLQALVEEKGLHEIVELTGPKSQLEIGTLLKRARIFALAAVVLPDGDSDNLPTVITEAMAYGVPVVSTRVAGIPEQVGDNVTGMLVEPGDVDGLADGLERLLADGTRARKLGNAGFEKAGAEFSLDKTVQRLRASLPIRPWWKFW